MPLLPNAFDAEVPEEKIRDYLLAPFHPVGRFKAPFFESLGFTSGDYALLGQAIIQLARSVDAIPAERTNYGQKYVVRGSIQGPNGRSALLQTLWIVLNSESHPRFITAYPGD